MGKKLLGDNSKIGKKLLIVFGCTVSLVLIVWGILVLFFPVTVIDGNPYSQRAISKLKEQYRALFTQRFDSLSIDLGNNIEDQFLTYMESISTQTTLNINSGQLSNILKEGYTAMNAVENQFMVEFENVLQNKIQFFTVPLQIKNITYKDNVLLDIFSTEFVDYSIIETKTIYNKIAVDTINEKLTIFKNEFPRIAHKVIEGRINSYYEQCLDNLKIYADIDTGIDNSLHDTIAYIRKQGDTLWFFDSLIEECAVTDFPQNKYGKTEPLDISKILVPVSLPVSIVNETAYDSYAVKTLNGKIESLRNIWKQTRRENITSIIRSQREIIMQNFALYADIDAEINIEKLSTLIAYYARQTDISLELFVLGLEQCCLKNQEASEYKNKDYLTVVNISPLPIDIVTLEDLSYDAMALQVLTEELAVLRNDWLQIKKSREENIRNIITKQRKIIVKNFASYTDIDEGIIIEELSEFIAYYARQTDVSKNLFVLWLEQCRLMVEDSSEHIPESYPDIISISSSSLDIDIITLEGMSYDAVALQVLTEEMTVIRSEWNRFIAAEDIKTGKIIEDKLRKYVNAASSGADTSFDTAGMNFSVNYSMEQADISGDLFLYFYECCSIPAEYSSGTTDADSVAEFDYTPLILKSIDIDEEPYYAAAVNALQKSMRSHASSLIANTRSGLSQIINSKTDECLNNVDPYLGWYFDWLANDLLTVGWRKLKELFTDYTETKELQEKYQQYFYPMLEMSNKIQNYLVLNNDIIQSLALCYVMVLDEFQIDPYLTAQSEQVMEGNDFMKPFKAAPDYIKSFISKAGGLLESSFVKAENIKEINAARIAVNTGAEFAIDAAGATIGGAIGGPPGAVIGFAVGIVAGLATDAVTSKAVNAAVYNPYRDAIVNSFEKSRKDLLATL